MIRQVRDDDAQDDEGDYNFEKKKNKEHWQGLVKSILDVLKTSIQKTKVYSAKLFENQKFYIRQMADQYLKDLKKHKQVKLVINAGNIWLQLKQKLIGITQLTFPLKKLQLKQINFKNKQLERWFILLNKGYDNNKNMNQIEQQVIITSDLIRNVIQYQSKLNYDQDLFILKSYLASESKDPYVISKPIKIPLIDKSTQYTLSLTLKPIHSYHIQNSTDIVISNIPSLNSVKKVYNTAMASEQVDHAKNSELRFNLKRILGKCEDNSRSSQNCFKYFGHAMELQFFNSLVQPISINRYLKLFSVIENRLICQGLILGALNVLLQQDFVEQFSESDDELQWEQQIQQICKEFCNKIFDGFFDGQQQNREIIRIGRNIWKIKRQSQKSVYKILMDSWCS